MPWITEKTLEARRVADLDNDYRENNNRIEFIVRRESTKTQIREAVEKLLDVKVAKVNTKITITGKHASIRLACLPVIVIFVLTFATVTSSSFSTA